MQKQIQKLYETPEYMKLICILGYNYFKAIDCFITVSLLGWP